MKYLKKYIKKYRLTPLACIKVLVCLLLLWGTWGVIQFTKQLKLKDIAYSNVFSLVNKVQGYTVYLKESDRYEPYLAISENYNGEAEPYWLRTPYTEHDTTIWFISETGEKHYLPLLDMTRQKAFKLSVRPAFCLPRNTKLVRKEGIVKGEKVFVLKEDDK